MTLNESYYRKLWRKFEKVKTRNDYNNNIACLTTKIILKHYWAKQSVHINFQESHKNLTAIGKHLFIELANDLYRNHYDLPGINDGDKVKRRANGEYYLVHKEEGSS
jgi:hypothetical protein